jgi:hypothetical protein
MPMRPNLFYVGQRTRSGDEIEWSVAGHETMFDLSPRTMANRRVAEPPAKQHTESRAGAAIPWPPGGTERCLSVSSSP